MPRCRRCVTTRRNGSCLACSALQDVGRARHASRRRRRPPRMATPTRGSASAHCRRNSGRFSASSLAGTSSDTTARPRHTRFRMRAGRMPSWSRYLATVRRAIWIPCSSKRCTICWSVSGFAGFPRPPSSRAWPGCERAEASSPDGGGERRREEELERQHAARRLHELLVGHATDGGLVHRDHLGDLAQGERAQVLDALLEELALPVDDEVHHLEHGLATLLDRLHHPGGAVHPGGDEVLVLLRHPALLPGDVLIGARQAEPRHAGVVQEDLVAPLDPIDDQVGGDVRLRRGRRT